MPDSGEFRIIDLGLPLEVGGTGEADWFLENGLLRTCPVFEAMLCACDRDSLRVYGGVRVEQLQAIDPTVKRRRRELIEN